MKTKEELNAMKQKMENLANEIKELSDEELDMVTGGQAIDLPTLKSHGNAGLIFTGKTKLYYYALPRGRALLNSSTSPLYVVDGVIMGSGMSNINPEDIESTTVLKDATSTMTLGSKKGK